MECGFNQSRKFPDDSFMILKDARKTIVGNIKNDIWIGSLYCFYVIFLFMLLNRNYVCMYNANQKKENNKKYKEKVNVVFN